MKHLGIALMVMACFLVVSAVAIAYLAIWDYAESQAWVDTAALNLFLAIPAGFVGAGLWIEH